MNPPPGSIPKSACASVICFRNFPVNASSSSPRTLFLTSKPWLPTSPSCITACLSLMVRRNRCSLPSPEESGRSSFPAPHFPPSNSSTSSAAPLIAVTASMFALSPALRLCRKHNRSSPPWKTPILLPSPAVAPLPREWLREHSSRRVCFRSGGFPRAHPPLQLSFHTGIGALFRLSRLRWSHHAATGRYARRL